MKKLILPLLLLVTATTMGCSSTLLQCGIDGDSSFVTVNATHKMITEGGRNMAELCAFGNQEPLNAT